MEKPENKYDKVIDNYYKESPEETLKELSETENHLSERLNLALDKMNILKTDNLTCDIDILEIIKKGQAITQKKKNSLEFLAFNALALFIILTLIIFTIYYGEKFFIYYELATFIFVPILIISLVKLSQTGGN